MFCRNPPSAISKRQKDKLRQANIKELCDKTLKADVHQYIGHFWYQVGLSFNLVKLNSFQDIIDGIVGYGPNLPAPSYNDIRVPLLNKEMKLTENLLKDHKSQWGRHGCFIMPDAQTDKKQQSIINILVNSPTGTKFLKSIDGSKFVKTDEKLFKLFYSLVDEIKEHDVVQVTTPSLPLSPKHNVNKPQS